MLDHIDGLHFHALCEQDSFALETVLKAVKEQFGNYLHRLKWLNLGGGHLITKQGYDTEHLISLLNDLHRTYPHLKLYLEPGEAVAWECGVLVARILDIIDNGEDTQIAILDTSAETHMPDVLAMPYQPRVRGAKEAFTAPYRYRLTGNSCLSGGCYWRLWV